MKTKKLLLLLFSFALLIPSFSTVSAEKKNTEPVQKVVNDKKVETEYVLTENGEATFKKATDNKGNVRAELIETNNTTIIDFNPNTNELFVNGVKHELEVTYESQKFNDFSTMSVPSGGTYVGAFKYSLNIASLTASAAAAALAAVSKAPYNACFAAVSVFIGVSSTLYYTVYQYRYPMKCSAIPYFNQTKVWKNSSRTTVSSTVESGKFFSTKPIPLSCTP